MKSRFGGGGTGGGGGVGPTGPTGPQGPQGAQGATATTSPTNSISIGSLGSNVNIASGVDTPVAFATYADPNLWWNATTKRLTPNIAGYYSVDYYGLWAPGSTSSENNLQILKNGNSQAIFEAAIDTAVDVSVGGTKVIYLNGSTDYLQFTAYTANTTSQTLQKARRTGRERTSPSR